MGREKLPGVPRLLAVVDSDSYLKWGCATLARLRVDSEVDAAVVVLRSPLAPTAEQKAAATAGTGLSSAPTLGPVSLARRIRAQRPEAVLIAATGPVADLTAAVVVQASRGRSRPVLLSGLPGMSLPASPLAVRHRRWTDGFIVHSHAERAAFADLFRVSGLAPQLALSRLPFLADQREESAPVTRLVFAPQALIPAAREDRVQILTALARLSGAGFEVTIKLRAGAGERQTHNEAHPYDGLWRAEHARLGYEAGALRFTDGAMAEQLRPGTALATVSSTAALESLSRGLPTALLDDFGVGAELLNTSFAGSGCLVSSQELPAVLAQGGPVPQAQWLECNYLHEDASEVPSMLSHLLQDRQEGVLPVVPLAPVASRLRTLLRSALPASLSSRFARPVHSPQPATPPRAGT